MKKKSHIKLFVSINLLLSCEYVSAQSEYPFQIKRDSSFIELFDSNTNSNNYFDHYKSVLGITNYDSFSSFKIKSSEDGSKHIFYQQKYNNVPLLGSRIVLHEVSGALKYITGSIIPNLSVNTTINIVENDAQNIAINWIKNKELIKMGLQGVSSEIILDSLQPPKTELYIYKPVAIDNSPSNYRTIYLVSAMFVSPFEGFFHAFVDATTGEVINYFSGSLGSTPGSVTTLYNGNHVIDTKWTGNITKYKLIDDSRGSGIETKKNPYGANQFLNDADNNWDDDFEKKIHGSTHWAAQNVWDYYKYQLNRNGTDENGKALEIITDLAGNSGAFGNKSYPGLNPHRIELRGPISGKTNPRVSINSLGHEFTHGVCSDDAGWNTVNLFGLENSEAYAMMEGFCDIFAEFAEFNHQGWVDWQYDAETLILNSDRRVYTLPVLDGKEAMFYGDNNWTNNPEGHSRCGVLLHWAYMLSVGETGSNNLSNQYCVKGIGIKKVEKILYNVLNQGYLANSTYNDLKFATYAVTGQLYGLYSNEIAQVKSAWYAVNRDVPFNGRIDLKNVIINTPQSYHYNSKIALQNVTTNAPAGLIVTSNTEIELLNEISFNSGSENELYITPVCLGGARIGNPNTTSDENTNSDLIENHSKVKDFVIMPNPTTGIFKLQANSNLEHPKQITIHNILGQTIFNIENPNSFEYEFNLLNQNAGIYMINVYYSNEVISKRIIKE